MSKGSCEGPPIYCLTANAALTSHSQKKYFKRARRKLVLDHLIVQKMDADEGADDIQSILTFGASDLFNEDPNDESKCITCKLHRIHLFLRI